MNAERPLKVYELTNNGQMLLNFTQGSLNLVCKAVGPEKTVKVEAATFLSPNSKFPKRTESLMHVRL